MTRKFSWKNEPNNEYWNTTINVETDYDTTEQEVRKFLNSIDWFDYEWAKNHRDEFPLTITITGKVLRLSHRTGNSTTTVNDINARKENLFSMLRAASK